MIRIGSDTDIGMNLNSSDWLGMNFYPILSPGVFVSPFSYGAGRYFDHSRGTKYLMFLGKI